MNNFQSRMPWMPPGVLGLLLLAGCSLFPEWESVSVEPPGIPASWSDCGLAPEWELAALWPGGSASGNLYAGGTSRLTLPRGQTAAVLAYPVWNGRRLLPAGAVHFPGSGSALRLSWEGGYQAEAARVLLRAGADPSRFDFERFLSEALERLVDPWTRPPENFAEDFAARRFRVVWLDPPDVFPVSVAGLPGPAVPESPFADTLMPDAAGAAALDLPAGISRWYAEWGRVTAQVGEDGSAVWLVIR